MANNIRKLIQNAKLAGINLPGINNHVAHRRPTSAHTPSHVSNAIFAAPEPRDYVLPNPFDQLFISISDANLKPSQQGAFYKSRMSEAHAAFEDFGFDARDMKSGRTYLLIAACSPDQALRSIYAQCHEHIGSHMPANREFMISLAAHESDRVRAVYERNRSDVTYCQYMMVIPPHDKQTGNIPWFEYKEGAGWGFNWYMHDAKTHQRMGRHLASLLHSMPTRWQSIPKGAQPAQAVDYMKEVRTSCGDLRKSTPQP